MRTGLNNEARIRNELCSNLQLPSTANTMQIIEALMQHVKKVEDKVDRLEFLLATDERENV